MKGWQVERMIQVARQRNRERDAADRKAGDPPLELCGLRAQLDTALEALKAAMVTRDWNIVAEAYALIEDIPEELTRTE